MPGFATTADQSPNACADQSPNAWGCQMCDCSGDDCDGTICHGFDAD
jgi:hypothetical protein